jgi:hypothetical protein
MSITTKAIAAAGILTLAGGLSAAGQGAASAATPQCSKAFKTCIEVYSAQYATRHSLGFVETMFRGIARRGVPAGVQRASRSNPAQDLIIPRAGTVKQFYALGLVSAAVNKHYGPERAVQLEYAPYGHPTGLCSAVAATAHQNQALSLQPCRRPGTTVWILDFADSPGTAPRAFPIVNGSDTDFVHPFAMTILGNPAHRRFTPIILRHLAGNPHHVPARQLWSAHFGVTPR